MRSDVEVVGAKLGVLEAHVHQAQESWASAHCKLTVRGFCPHHPDERLRRKSFPIIGREKIDRESCPKCDQLHALKLEQARIEIRALRVQKNLEAEALRESKLKSRVEDLSRLVTVLIGLTVEEKDKGLPPGSQVSSSDAASLPSQVHGEETVDGMSLITLPTAFEDEPDGSVFSLESVETYFTAVLSEGAIGDDLPTPSDNSLFQAIRASTMGCLYIAQVVKSMQEWPADTRILRNCCKSLYKIAEKGYKNKILIAASGGIGAILTAMRKHRLSVPTQKWACAALFSLCLQRENVVEIKEKLAEENAIVTAMDNHKEDECIQVFGAGALSIMGYSARSCVSFDDSSVANFSAVSVSSPELQISPSMGGESTVSGERDSTPPTTPTLQPTKPRARPQVVPLTLNTTPASISVSQSNPQGPMSPLREEMTGERGLEREVKDLRREVSNLRALLSRQQSLGQVTTTSTASAGEQERSVTSASSFTAASADSMPVALKGMNANQENPDAQENGLNVLFNSLASEIDRKDSKKVKQMIAATVKAMAKHRDHVGVQRGGCGVLFRLSTIESNADKFRYGIPCIIAAMNHHGDAQIQLYGISALCNLAQFLKKNRAMIGQEGAAAIVLAMRSEQNVWDTDIQRLGCKALLICSSSNQCMVRIAQKESVRAIICAMNKHIADAHLQEYGVGLLHSLVHVGAFAKDIIADAGGMQAVVAAMKVHNANKNIQERGRDILKHL